MQLTPYYQLRKLLASQVLAHPVMRISESKTTETINAIAHILLLIEKVEY